MKDMRTELEALAKELCAMDVLDHGSAVQAGHDILAILAKAETKEEPRAIEDRSGEITFTDDAEPEEPRGDANFTTTTNLPVSKRWRCTNCGIILDDQGAIAHADLPTTIKVWHKNSDGIWCGPLELKGDTT